ncbi:phage capsid and scaffold [Pseudomonas phage PA01]|uniref:Phage capsid and scaffold n=1 Tax=Pseudomonas phage PA01 TaxID=2498591 RepID=A0A455VYB6_9CAUD|nr:tail length tape measure protein [Pseudomonas phage PA01]BBI98253.1 phage capsid and scaffold [Pseudomonas phage PA01]
MSSIVYFQYITGTIQVPLEVEVEAGQLQMVNVEVDPDGFRKFWPIADSLLWDAEECKFRPRYETHYMGGAVKHADQAVLAFAAGQYYLRMESKEERKDPDDDLHASELSAMRETCRKAKVEKHQLVRENTRLDECLQNSIARENETSERNRQLQIRIQDLEAEIASQKALREELDRSLDGSIQSANNQHKLAREAREQMVKAREEAEFYRIGMQKIAAIANMNPFEDY